EQTLGRTCKVLMDLGGPKLRTGALEPGLPIVKWRPLRDDYGNVTGAARIWVTAADHPTPSPPPAGAALRVSGAWVSRVRSGDMIEFEDCRGADRTLTVVDNGMGGCWAECRQTSYVTDGISLRHVRKSAASSSERAVAPVEGLPYRTKDIVLSPGDVLILTKDLIPGRHVIYDSVGCLLSLARISCTLSAIFDDVQSGERIWLDDGKIGGVIERTNPDHLQIRITQAKLSGEKLGADKGINLPDSTL